MKTPVHILATVRTPEMLPAACLVFASLRRGFPDNTVYVWGNGLDAVAEREIVKLAKGVNATYKNLPMCAHDGFIEGLIHRLQEPFWICDTDVVFWDAMPPEGEGYPVAGRFEPEYFEEWTQTVHVERLHTCVMWINPKAVRETIRQFMCAVPKPWRDTAEFTLVRQTFVPRQPERVLFFDTMAGYWMACGGRPFTEEENACFEHLHCGCSADLAEKDTQGETETFKHLRARHAQVYEDINAARGMREKEAEYYEKQSTKRKELAA